MSRLNERRRRLKGRQSTKSFVMFPHELLEHVSVSHLSPRGAKLLLDIAVQYNGHNNGDLCAPLSLMKKRSWNSSDQLFKARKELIDRGLIKTSRQGGLNKCSLFALTWFQIDECEGKLDVRATSTPTHDWKQWPAPNCGLERS